MTAVLHAGRVAPVRATPSPVMADVPLRPLPIPAAVRAGFRIGWRVAPELTLRAARDLSFRPPRTRARPDQAAVLAAGARRTVLTRAGPLSMWTWGTGSPVLLVHGWGGNAGQFAPFIAPLLARGHRAVAIDLPAHGTSPGTHASVLHFARAILDASEHIGPLDGVIAHSLGGAGVTLAMDWGLRARRAAFVAPPSRFANIFDRISEGFGLDTRLRRQLERRAEDWVGLRFADVEPFHLAPRQRTPLLIVHDERDDEMPFSEGAELASRWPGARLEAVSGLGHYRVLRDEGVIGECVREI